MPKRNSRPATDHGEWAVPYQPAYIADLDPAMADQPMGIPRPPLVDAVYRIVETEGPIHGEVLRLHFGELLYSTRPRSIWNPADKVADQLVAEGRLAETDGFYDIPGRPCTHARSPLPGLTKRPVEHVAPAERRRALLGVVEDRPGLLDTQKVLVAAARFFGWSPSAGRAPARLMADLYRLRDSGAVRGWPDKLEPADGS